MGLLYSMSKSIKVPMLFVVILAGLLIWACSDSVTEDDDPIQTRENLSADSSPSEEIQSDKADTKSSEGVKAETPAFTEGHSISPELQQQLQLRPQTLKRRLKLNLPDHHIQSLNIKPQDILQTSVAEKVRQKEDPTQTLKIKGGILTDPNAQDLIKCIDGAEVKLDLKWD